MNAKRLLSRASRINLTLLCVGFLLFVLIVTLEFLGTIVGILAATIILTYLLLGPVQVVESLLGKTPASRYPWFSAGFRRTLAIALVYLLLVTVAALASIRIIPPLSQQVKEFAHDIPVYVARFSTPPPVRLAPQTPSPAEIKPGLSVEEARQKSVRNTRIVANTANLAIRKVVDIYKQYVSKLGELLLDIGTSTLTGIIYLLTILVMVFIFLLDGRGLKNGFVELMPSRYEKPVAQFLERLHLQFHQFIKAQIFMSLISGGLIYILLSLLEIKYALLLSVFFGMASILPVIGPWIGLIPITLFIAFGNHPIYIVQVILYSGIFYLLKTYWLWPHLIDRRFDIHPIIFVLSFIICLKLVGYAGILLSFPLASIVSISLEYLKAAQQSPATQTHLALD